MSKGNNKSTKFVTGTVKVSLKFTFNFFANLWFVLTGTKGFRVLGSRTVQYLHVKYALGVIFLIRYNPESDVISC